MIKLLSTLCALITLQNVYSQTICTRYAANFDVPFAGYVVNGSATLTDSLGTLYLTFSSDFSTSPGPDLYVYLTETGHAPTAPGNDDYEIALLISDTGAQSYTLPSSISIDDYDYVTIHCKQYNHLWNSALLATETCFTYPTYSSQTMESCISVTSPSGNHLWTTTGTYTDTLIGMNTEGGDSIITIDLTIYDEVDVSVTTSNTSNELTAEAINATFQWINCQDHSILPGETNSNFNPTQNGDYAVVVTTPDNCIDTSACFLIQSIGVLENQIETYVTFPNPSTGFLTIQTHQIDPNSIQIYNNLNQRISFDLLTVHQNEIRINLNAPTGVYQLLFKNKSGDVKVTKLIRR